DERPSGAERLLDLNADVRHGERIGRKEPLPAEVGLTQEIVNASTCKLRKRRTVGLVAAAHGDRAVKPDAVQAQLTGRREEVLNARAGSWPRRRWLRLRHRVTQVRRVRGAAASKNDHRGGNRG